VRRNDDNWTAYAIGKYLYRLMDVIKSSLQLIEYTVTNQFTAKWVESKIGMYPALPIVDGAAYGKSDASRPDAMFLDTPEGWILNEDVYQAAPKTVEVLHLQGNSPENQSFENLTFREDSDYPDWYIKHLQDVRSGNYPSNGDSPTPSVGYEDHCADQTVYTSFDYGTANTGIFDFCKGGLDLTVPSAPLWNTYDHTGMKLHLGIQWSVRSGAQEGCNAYQNSDHIDENTCVTQFLATMNRCNKETISKKYGQHPMTWNSPGGCVDFWLVGHGADWDCDSGDLDNDPAECVNGKRKGQ
jgi:hypothetical protein